MAAANWMLRTLCAAALHLSLPSAACGLLQDAVVSAAVGQNVSLSCNLTTACREVTWFAVREDTVLLLLTVRKSKLSGGDTVERHSLGTDRAWLVGAQQQQQQLLLLRVEEADSGLYFCSGECEGTHRIDPGVSLLVGGGPSDIQPCWSPTLCLLPSSIVLLLSTCMWLCLCAAKPIKWQHWCCSFGGGQRLDVAEEASLQYSSLKLRPLSPPARGVIKSNQVIYAAVKLPRQSATAGEIL